VSIQLSDFRKQPLSILEVHLDKVCRNYLFLKKKLKNGTDCAAVVKADAYGLGAVPVARALYDQGCRHFFVAHAGEGMIVREELQEKDALIYVLNGPWGASAEEFLRARLIPVLNTLGDIEYWKTTDTRRPAIIQIDTGMNRLGLSASDVQTLPARKDWLDALDLRFVMSHLACADAPTHLKNKEQLALFEKLSSSLNRPLRLSLANSAGIFLGPDYHFDMARPGCALYGINPVEGSENPMQGTVTLKSRILQIRDIAQAGTVGYGAGYKISPPAKCATISVGYADGYFRSFTGKGFVHIGSEKCPVIGRVSMDTIVVDITKLKTPVAEGDFADIIGAQHTVDDAAKEAGTIGYEILTALGKRYQRLYQNG
jgi:alanine racemase